jgi:hypothetical protein
MMIFLVFLELYAGYLSAITLGGYSVERLSSLRAPQNMAALGGYIMQNLK